MKTKRAQSPGDYIAMVRRVLAAAGRRIGEADPEDLADLIALKFDLDEAIAAAVAGQRDSGITWQSIGDATGTTRQAAIQKWGTRRATTPTTKPWTEQQLPMETTP